MVFIDRWHLREHLHFKKTILVVQTRFCRVVESKARLFFSPAVTEIQIDNLAAFFLETENFYEKLKIRFWVQNQAFAANTIVATQNIFCE